MKWVDLLHLVGEEPVFTSSLLRSGNVSDGELRSQLSRWTRAGKILQLRRGLYLLAPPYRKIEPHPFLIANHLRDASYVSLQSALAHYGLIPEHVPVVTSVTTKRPELLKTPMGLFSFRHIKRAAFLTYAHVEIARKQYVYIATPEKALLDLLYLTPRGENSLFLGELRLQHLETIDADALLKSAECFGSAKILRGVEQVKKIIEKEEYTEL